MGNTVIMAIAVLCNLALAFPRIVHSEELPRPQTDVLLTISGTLSHPNVDDAVQLDLAALESLPVTEFTTTTPWHDEPLHFAGVRISTLFEAIGADSTSFVAVGLDDYRFTVSELDFDKYPVIIAYRQNDEPISVRNLGPLRIIMPFSEYPELLTPINESRSVWQLVALEIL